MALFRLRGVELEIPDHALRGAVTDALTRGTYEHSEADALLAHLRPGDRFMDLGAGAGYLCCLAAGMLGPDAVTGVEAAPDMVLAARANLARNGFADATVLAGAVVPDGHQGATASFGIRPSFWASALAGAKVPGNARLTTVPALRLSDLLAAHPTTVLCCDIEGGERDVLTASLPRELRLIVLETHPAVYGTAGIQALRDGLLAQGFAAVPKGTRGAVVVFARDK